MQSHLVLLPDADISEPENDTDSDDDYQQDTDSSEGSVTDSDDDVPLSNLMKTWTETKDTSKKTQAKVPPHTFRWSQLKAPVPSRTQWSGKFTEPPEEEMTPISYFRQFFTSQLVDHIVQQTNLLAVQRASNFRTDGEEIEKYVGILIKMGIVPMPSYKSYWSDELRFPAVADVMGRNRFTDINRFLHFNDNDKTVTDRDDPSYDRYYKVRPLLDIIREGCLSVEPEERMSVDEQIIPYKGKNPLRQYLQKNQKNGGSRFSPGAEQVE